ISVENLLSKVHCLLGVGANSFPSAQIWQPDLKHIWNVSTVARKSNTNKLSSGSDWLWSWAFSRLEEVQALAWGRWMDGQGLSFRI
ncbi:hypothetical protein, partial [uncultured Roseobacter sp.]|uniref:hypothetical protein n=1 Tax=uncultured Roseobacter sp. TaxID=114847 RepID=UPI002614DFF0